MADDGAAAVIAGSSALEPVAEQLEGLLNRLQNALNDKSRLQLIRSADFSYSCAEAEQVVGKVHEDDGKVVALVIVVPRLRDPEGADALCEALLRWPEDRQKVKEQLATARAADEGRGGAGGKSAGKLDPATLPASVAAPTAFEANVPQGYNAPTALTELAATQPIATTSTADATATDAAPAPEPAPTLEPEPGPTAAVAATEEAGTEAVAATATAESARVEAQASGAEFSLNVLQSSCPPGVDPKHKEKSLAAGDFQAAMGCTKDEFDALPKWKQTSKKKAAKLF